MSKPLREKSALVYVLVALIPYSKPNMLLTFKPRLFFRELEKISRYKQATLKAAYRRAERQGLIVERQSLIDLTARGRLKVAPFTASDLDGGKLMVIFDIPEEERSKRRKFRSVLKEWDFMKVQQSVWLTDKDYKSELIDLVRGLELDKYVQFFECSKIKA